MSKLAGKYTDNQGFTLVELLMTMAIIGILLVAIQAMLVTGMDAFNREKREIDLRSQLYSVTEEFGRLVRNTPAQKIQFTSDDGIYQEILLDNTRIYLDGEKIYEQNPHNQRLLAEKISEFELSVVTDVFNGSFDAYDPTTLHLTDSDGNFADRDPNLRGMVICFENDSLGYTRYIYRRIVGTGPDWIKLDRDFTPGFTPTNWNYAIGQTYQIRIKTEGNKGSKGVEVITGVKPRL